MSAKSAPQRAVAAAKRLILFDVDGTLLSTGPAARTTFASALQDVFGTSGDVDGYAFEGRLDPLIVTDLMRGAGVAEETIAARRADALARFLDGRIGQSDYRKARLTVRDVDFDIHERADQPSGAPVDAGGKDGTIRRVFEGVNPQGVKVASFKVPTPPELDHDYLWRVHPHVPGKGEMVIFNRSHYEDVLAVRVHKLAPPEVWRARYEQISDFEKMLSQEGTLILKFFLNIGFDEQKQRLRDRLVDETKLWKFNPGDLKERELWKDYMEAYEDVLNRTNTDHAPWYVVPSDHKWFRDWAVATSLVEALRNLKMEYPKPSFDVAAMLRDFDKIV